MRKIFLIQPRQSGKTTKAIYEFIKDPENTMFVTHNYDTVKLIHSRVGGNIKNFTSANEFHNKIIGRRPKNIILDEYMLFNNRDEIYEEIQIIEPENVYIFTSADKLYNEKIFNFVKQNKRNTSYVNLLLKLSDNNIPHIEHIEKQVYDLYYNFLTDEDTIIIDFDLSGKTKNKYHYCL